MQLDIRQVAYYVQDAEQAALKMRNQFGCGPFQLVRNIELDWATYNDQPIEFVHTSAYGQWGDVMLELVQLDSNPFPLFNTHGVHHVAVMVEDQQEAYRYFESLGYPVALKAMTTTGTEFAYVDARSDIGHLIEIYEANESLTGFYSYIKNVANSEGSAFL